MDTVADKAAEFDALRGVEDVADGSGNDSGAWSTALSWVMDRSSWFVFLLRDAARVWMGRIVVTIAIVVVWDVCCAFAERKRNQTREPKPQPKPQSQPKAQPQLQPQQKEQQWLKPSVSGPRKSSDEDRKTVRAERSSSPDVSDQLLRPESTIPSTEHGKDSIHKVDGGRQELCAVASASPPASSSPSSSPSPLPNTTSSSIPETTKTKTPAKRSKTPTTARTIPKIKATSDEHPGMEEFAHWYEVETSLYRIYTLVHRDPSVVTVPPYVPHSHRGNVSIELHVTNNTDRTINVFWVDFQGNYVPKGTIPRHNGVWTQTTWIDHPWVFQDATASTPYLYYVPYRAIPTIPVAPTIGSDGSIGLHKFALTNSSSNSSSNSDDHLYHIGIRDEIMPFPGISQLHQPLHAVIWTLRHLSRAYATSSHHSLFSDVDTLQKYLINILNHPDRPKYRQLRIASDSFRSIWASPLRGLLLAIGFVEVGPCAELGCHDKALSSHRVQDVALLSYLLNEWKWKETESAALPEQQPHGATDGFGRAGFGRAGAMG